MRFPLQDLVVGVLTASLLAACRGPATRTVPVPSGLQAIDGGTGAVVSARELAGRLASADAVLLGELHDNPAHHRVRAELLRGAGGRAAPVFEHFARTAAPLPAPTAGEGREAWLDRTGFDREGWAWPLHAPLIDAAVASGRPMRGANLDRVALRDVVRRGAAAAAPPLASLVAAAPLDSAARAGLDADLVAGHCGQLPTAMIPGMRDAQVVRDAAMAEALLDASRDGVPWLLAGNGHVRRDLAVPRYLAAVRPQWRVLVVGFVEQDSAGRPPPVSATRGRYDLVVVTSAPAGRPDPCAAFRQPSRRP